MGAGLRPQAHSPGKPHRFPPDPGAGGPDPSRGLCPAAQPWGPAAQEHGIITAADLVEQEVRRWLAGPAQTEA